MRGEDVGAWCLSGVGRLALAPHAMPTEAPSHQDKHQTPTQLHIRPLSLQNGERPAFIPPIRVSQFSKDACVALVLVSGM